MSLDTRKKLSTEVDNNEIWFKQPKSERLKQRWGYEYRWIILFLFYDMGIPEFYNPTELSSWVVPTRTTQMHTRQIWAGFRTQDMGSKPKPYATPPNTQMVFCHWIVQEQERCGYFTVQIKFSNGSDWRMQMQLYWVYQCWSTQIQMQHYWMKSAPWSISDHCCIDGYEMDRVENNGCRIL